MYSSLVFHICHELKSHISSSKTSSASHNEFRIPPAFSPLFAELKILDIFKVNSLCIAKCMLLYYHHLLPLPFKNLFFTNNQMHNYDTRASSLLRPHMCRTNIKQCTILYQGPSIWNALPLSITSLSSLSSFKDSLLISLTIKCHSK